MKTPIRIHHRGTEITETTRKKTIETCFVLFSVVSVPLW